ATSAVSERGPAGSASARTGGSAGDAGCAAANCASGGGGCKTSAGGGGGFGGGVGRGGSPLRTRASGGGGDRGGWGRGGGGLERGLSKRRIRLDRRRGDQALALEPAIDGRLAEEAGYSVKFRFDAFLSPERARDIAVARTDAGERVSDRSRHGRDHRARAVKQ